MRSPAVRYLNAIFTSVSFWLITLSILNVSTAFAGEEKGNRIVKAVEILARSAQGQLLIQRALKAWNLATVSEVVGVLKWGDASRTDAVLTRHYNPATGLESRERQVTVYLREKQSLQNLVLDIAHELVHATSRPAWDPYDPELTAGKYVWTAIEGPGGEVEAVVAECQVGIELADYGVSAERCEQYLSGNRIDAQKVRRDFYRVGKWNHEITERLGGELKMFPLVSQEAPKLYSSTGNAPYPAALLHEYDEITQIACENSRKRGLASVENRISSSSFLTKRCHPVY